MGLCAAVLGLEPLLRDELPGRRSHLELSGGPRRAHEDQQIVGFALHPPVLFGGRKRGLGAPLDVKEKARLLAAVNGLAALLLKGEGTPEEGARGAVVHFAEQVSCDHDSQQYRLDGLVPVK